MAIIENITFDTTGFSILHQNQSKNVLAKIHISFSLQDLNKEFSFKFGSIQTWGRNQSQDNEYMKENILASKTTTIIECYFAYSRINQFHENIFFIAQIFDLGTENLIHKYSSISYLL